MARPVRYFKTTKATVAVRSNAGRLLTNEELRSALLEAHNKALDEWAEAMKIDTQLQFPD